MFCNFSSRVGAKSWSREFWLGRLPPVSRELKILVVAMTEAWYTPHIVTWVPEM